MGLAKIGDTARLNTELPKCATFKTIDDMINQKGMENTDSIREIIAWYKV
jgi:hypothetical protein